LKAADELALAVANRLVQAALIELVKPWRLEDVLGKLLGRRG
jgi:hypothetical protein